MRAECGEARRLLGKTVLSEKEMTQHMRHGTHKPETRPGEAAAHTRQRFQKQLRVKTTTALTWPWSSRSAGQEELPLLPGAAGPGPGSEKGQRGGTRFSPACTDCEEGKRTLRAFLQKESAALSHPQGPRRRQRAPHTPQVTPEDEGETRPLTLEEDTAGPASGIFMTPQLRAQPAGKKVRGAPPPPQSPPRGLWPTRICRTALSASLEAASSLVHKTHLLPGSGWTHDTAQGTYVPRNSRNLTKSSARLTHALPSPQ